MLGQKYSPILAEVSLECICRGWDMELSQQCHQTLFMSQLSPHQHGIKFRPCSEMVPQNWLDQKSLGLYSGGATGVLSDLGHDPDKSRTTMGLNGWHCTKLNTPFNTCEVGVPHLAVTVTVQIMFHSEVPLGGVVTGMLLDMAHSPRWPPSHQWIKWITLH